MGALTNARFRTRWNTERTRVSKAFLKIVFSASIARGAAAPS